MEALVEEFARSEEGLAQAVARVGAALPGALARGWERSPDRRRLVFLHIMKVGGTSLCDMMSGWLPGNRSRVHMFLDQLVLQPRLVTGRLDLIAGHLPYEALELVPGNYSTMCVLRDPHARTLSHYKDLRRNVANLAELSVDEFLSSDQFAVPRGNYQARQLVHEIGVSDAWVTFSPLEPYLARQGDPDHPYIVQALFDSTPVTLDDDKMLETARSRLENMDIVGTTDDLDAVGRAAAAFFGVPPEPVPHLNVAPASAREALSASDRRRLDELTAVDRELYDLARRLSP